HAPLEIIKGALLAASESTTDIILVGRQEVVQEKLRELNGSVPRTITVVDARDVVEMEDTALAPLRKKKDASVRVCATLVSEGKGNELTKETFRVLKETGLNFIGNAEGRDIYNGNADVVVCDGFIGNVVLKASEALGEFVSRTLRDELTKSITRKAGAFLAQS